MIKVLELKGIKSLKALNVFNTLLLGLKMLPMYMQSSYEDFYDKVQEMPHVEQLKLLREAAMFVELQPDEVEAVIGFCTDRNGVPYGSSNIKNLKPDEILEMIVAVCGEIAKIKISLISEDEKKNSLISQ